MATYLFRCEVHGVDEIRMPMGDATASRPCPQCGANAKRVYTAPSLNNGDRRAIAAIDRTSATAESPPVVNTPPPRNRGRVASNPALSNPMLRKLPRP